VLQVPGINSKDKKKPNLVAAKTVHILRGKAFFELVKEQRSDLVTLNFDCQKKLPIPKLPDQMVCYSHQPYLYNFTIVKGSSPGSVYSY
jgi:hypothetical protein